MSVEIVSLAVAWCAVVLALLQGCPSVAYSSQPRSRK